MNKTVRIVEDEDKVARLLATYLAQAGFTTHCIDNGLDATPWIRQHQPDLVLLDLMLPGADGLDVCRDARVFSQVPIIMVTARVEEIDRLLGLELGADDYICKPFSPREVVPGCGRYCAELVVTHLYRRNPCNLSRISCR